MVSITSVRFGGVRLTVRTLSAPLNQMPRVLLVQETTATLTTTQISVNEKTRTT